MFISSDFHLYVPKIVTIFATDLRTKNKQRIMEKNVFLMNAFSLQMVDVPCIAIFEEVGTLPNGLTSAIGHQDTANVLGVPMNRVNVHLSEGDIAYVAQLQGGRLPEGSKTLPDGFSFKFIKVKVVNLESIKNALYQAYGQGCFDSANADNNYAERLIKDLGL